jgi:cytidine deaminase
MPALTQHDSDLIDAARSSIARRYREGYRHIGAALRTRSGRIFMSVHLEANVGCIAVCAEAVAIGMAAAEGEPSIDPILAVDPCSRVVAPCALCRELISDTDPAARVIVPGPDGAESAQVLDLIPNPYTREA